MPVTKVKCKIDKNSIETIINQGNTKKKQDYIFEFEAKDVKDYNEYINKRINDYIKESKSAIVVDKYNVVILTQWYPIGNADACKENGLIKVKMTGEVERLIVDENSDLLK